MYATITFWEHTLSDLSYNIIKRKILQFKYEYQSQSEYKMQAEN